MIITIMIMTNVVVTTIADMIDNNMYWKVIIFSVTL